MFVAILKISWPASFFIWQLQWLLRGNHPCTCCYSEVFKCLQSIESLAILCIVHLVLAMLLLMPWLIWFISKTTKHVMINLACLRSTFKWFNAIICKYKKPKKRLGLNHFRKKKKTDYYWDKYQIKGQFPFHKDWRDFE